MSILICSLVIFAGIEIANTPTTSVRPSSGARNRVTERTQGKASLSHPIFDIEVTR